MLNAETPQVVFAGSGTRGPFTLSVNGTPITFTDASQIKLYRYDETDEAGVLLVQDDDYTISVNSVATGASAATVTLDGSQPVLADGQRLLAARVTPLSQALSFQQTGGFSSQATEAQLDKTARQVQELDFIVRRRAVLLDPLNAGSSAGLLTEPLSPAKLLAVNAAGTGIEQIARADFAVASGLTGEYTATGGETEITVSEGVDNAWQLELYINGVRQQPEDDYTVDGSDTVTLASALTNGDDVWWLHSGSTNAFTGLSAAMTPVVQAATLAAARDAMGLEIGSDVASQAAMLAQQALTVNLGAPISAAMATVIQQTTVIAGQVRFFGGDASLATAISTDEVISIIDRTGSGGVGKYKLAIGRYASTNHPDFAVDLGLSQPTVSTGNLRLSTPGDGMDIYTTLADGTPGSPTVRSGAYSALALYNWSYDSTGSTVAQQSDQAGIHTFGRSAQIRIFQSETPTQTARGGTISIGITKKGQRTPFDAFWFSSETTAPRFAVFAGAAWEDSAAAYPYSASGLETKNIFSPMSGINPIDYIPPGVVTILARDRADAAAFAIMSNTDVNEGHYFSYEKSSGELWVRRSDNGSVTDLARFGKTASYVDLGFSANTGGPALRAFGITSQVDRIEIRGGDGSNHPQILIDGTTTNADLRLKAKGTGAVKIDGFLLDLSGASSGQIKFPSSQNASADANTLDDYEEGTWTPVLTFATPGDVSVTYATQTGTYTKVGRVVHVTCTVETSAFTHTTANGELRVTGLPFTSGSPSGAGLTRFQGLTKAGYTHFGVNLGSGATHVSFIASASASSVSSIVETNVPTGGTVQLRFSLFYIV